MELLVLALAPGVAIIWFIYLRDKYDKEPFKALVKAFLLGMAVTLPAMILQWGGFTLLNHLMQATGWTYYIVFAFLVVALGEETCKYFMLRYYAFPRPFFNEPFDGIIYGVMVAMGFATVENIVYVVQRGYETGFLRMFLSVPAHATFGILMGYYVGLAKFTSRGHSVQLMVRGLLLAVLFHGLYDLFLFVQADSGITRNTSTSILFASAVLSYLVAIRLSWKAIKMHQSLSKKYFNTTNNSA